MLQFGITIDVKFGGALVILELLRSKETTLSSLPGLGKTKCEIVRGKGEKVTRTCWSIFSVA